MIDRSAIFWIPTLTLLLGCETPPPPGPPMPTLPTGNFTAPAIPVWEKSSVWILPWIS